MFNIDYTKKEKTKKKEKKTFDLAGNIFFIHKNIKKVN